MIKNEQVIPGTASRMRWSWAALAATAAVFGGLCYYVTITPAIDRLHTKIPPTAPPDSARPSKALADATPDNARESSADAEGVVAQLEETSQEQKTNRAELDAFYASASGRYLSTFLSESPDILGWNGYLEMLAADAQLDPSSVREDGEGIKGNFVIQGTGVTIAFAINDNSCRIESQGSAPLGGLGQVEFRTSVAFETTNGDIPEANGVVQFFPRHDQRFYEEQPVGYVYKASEKTTAFRPLRGEVRDGGKYWLVVPNEDTNRLMDAGGLGFAYSWMQHLNEVQRLRSRETADR